MFVQSLKLTNLSSLTFSSTKLPGLGIELSSLLSVMLCLRMDASYTLDLVSNESSSYKPVFLWQRPAIKEHKK